MSRRVWILVGWMIPGVAYAQGLDAAFKAELEELTAEKTALSRSLADTKSTTELAHGALQKEIEELTASLSRARAQNAMRSQKLPESERAHSLEAQERQMDQIIGQIHAWMTTRNVDVSKDASLEQLISRVLDHIREGGGLHTEEGEYFGEDGLAKKGSLLRIAQVAAVARDDASIPLVVAGDGSFRAARGVEADLGVVPGGEVLGVVLFDPREAHTPESYHRETWLSWMKRGGPIMWPLAVLGFIGLVLAVERTLAFVFAGVRVRRFRGRLARNASVHTDDVGDWLLAPAALVRTTAGPPEVLEERAADALLQAKPHLTRGVSFLGIVAAVSPLIGLLGTVTGMIRTFSVITEHGTGDPRLLSAGISEALLTTQLGLTIAVPALLLHTGLLRWAHVVLASVERFAIRLLEEKKEESDG